MRPHAVSTTTSAHYHRRTMLAEAQVDECGPNSVRMLLSSKKKVQTQKKGPNALSIRPCGRFQSTEGFEPGFRLVKVDSIFCFHQ